MVRHIDLGAVIGAGLTRHNVSIERATVENTVATLFYLGFYTTSVNTDGSIAAPANNAVPVLESKCHASVENIIQYNAESPAIPGPVWVGLSTTENSYTATASTVRIDVDIDEYELPPIGLSTVNNSGAANQLAVWTNAQAPHLLYDIFATDLNNSAQVQLYLMLFATDIAQTVNGNTPIMQWPIPVAPSTAGVGTSCVASLYAIFGSAPTGLASAGPGMKVFQVGTQPGLGSLTSYHGCTLAISSKPKVLTLASATAAYLTARYL